MNNAVPILAALCAIAAVLARVPRWPAPESRPFTVGLGLLAVWALLRTPAVSRPAAEWATPSGHFENLPGLAASVALVAAGGLIGVAVADAWGRPILKKAFYVGLILVEAALLLSYDPVHTSELMIEWHQWILAIAGIAGNAAIFIAALLSYRAVPAQFRLPLGLFVLGGGAGVLVALLRVETLVWPNAIHAESWAAIASLPIFAFAIGSLIASARMNPARERIEN